MKIKQITIPPDQLLDILLGNTKKVSIPSKEDCKYLDQYLSDQEYISNVLGGCGPVTYEYMSPYGKVGKRVQIKGTNLKFTISRIDVDEKKWDWVLYFN